MALSMGVVLGRATAAHAKLEHGNSSKRQKGSLLKATKLDTAKKARTDTLTTLTRL